MYLIVTSSAYLDNVSHGDVIHLPRQCISWGRHPLTSTMYPMVTSSAYLNYVSHGDVIRKPHLLRCADELTAAGKAAHPLGQRSAQAETRTTSSKPEFQLVLNRNKCQKNTKISYWRINEYTLYWITIGI